VVSFLLVVKALMEGVIISRIGRRRIEAVPVNHVNRKEGGSMCM